MEEWEEITRRIATAKEAVEEVLEELLDICFVGAEGVNAVAVAQYEASQYARWMGGVWRDEQVEV